MLTDDTTARASFEVQGKVPLLATRVDDVEIELRPSPALARAALWPAAAAPADIKPAKMFADHVKLNKDKEIGSASCRERVCQYVKISVVAVSIKKKNKTDKKYNN